MRHRRLQDPPPAFNCFHPIPGEQTLIHCANFVRHLSKELGNVTGIAALLFSAWDADVGLFRMTPEGTGDIQSSALALTVAEQVKIMIKKRCREGKGCVCIGLYLVPRVSWSCAVNPAGRL